ncbi:hypothetical protein [Amycolatopsis cihanbeyliensis]|uniref:Helix-hairpin-helix protein n=1 Tax=Amycolatopsis cihanbeyliensis TaxID=1128664 RepID=A0A542DK33_AMYCI|nr:hypothetical protein [Amycolatopsis cihanbeyliensis]TQJ03453.1 hypothetical protein FB471_3213 [Amycolatopsis cihanbeyliensis]
MTTLTQLRKAALSFPETAEQEIRRGMVAFTVREKRFAATGTDKDVQLNLPAADIEEFLAEYPTAERLSSGVTPVGVRVPFQDIDGQRLNHWVRRAWLARAPKRLANQVAAGDTVTPGGVGDLPKAIGKPATQALTSAGITTLAQVSGLTDAELLAMHGVGPKAVRVLRETLGTT